MWLFADFGVLMPALIPQSVLDAGKTPDIREAAERGWELQVRGRIREHLQYFCDTYMPADSYSKIYDSPDKDYNVRFYTTREAYGDALKAMALDIDYTKFKDTAKRHRWGKKYYDLLIKVWSASTMLAPAGGWYAPRTKNNPRGFDKRKNKIPARGSLGSTFFDDDPWFGEPDLEEMNLDVDLLDIEDQNYLRRNQRSHRSIHDMTDDELEDYFNA